ncbi:MAG TPA: HAD family hydrolase [Vicinamibacterales bacterium]|jgi:D-glycero-D-manno-heptose 1,7-bisphosphate phosphatase
MRPAVFLDRDGTVIEEVGYLNRLDRVAFFPWTVDAIRVLNESGFLVVVVTNQAGVARGYFEDAFVKETHAFIDGRLRGGRARIDAYYYCPHHPDGLVPEFTRPCECRKPKPGLIHRAARDLDIDLAHSFVVGDRWLDVELGRAAGTRTVLVRTGYGSDEEARPQDSAPADHVADNLMAAAAWILSQPTDTET